MSKKAKKKIAPVRNFVVKNMFTMGHGAGTHEEKEGTRTKRAKQKRQWKTQIEKALKGE